MPMHAPPVADLEPDLLDGDHAVDADDRGLHLLEFVDRRGLEREILVLRRRTGAVVLPGAHAYLDEIEEMARPALPVMKKALKDQPNKYIIRVANRAVNDLLGTENKVP